MRVGQRPIAGDEHQTTPVLSQPEDREHGRGAGAGYRARAVFTGLGVDGCITTALTSRSWSTSSPRTRRAAWTATTVRTVSSSVKSRAASHRLWAGRQSACSSSRRRSSSSSRCQCVTCCTTRATAVVESPVWRLMTSAHRSRFPVCGQTEDAAAAGCSTNRPALRSFQLQMINYLAPTGCGGSATARPWQLRRCT